ncbi:hypothetical protein GCM10022221_80940 [Actinocorallia aurea]
MRPEEIAELRLRAGRCRQEADRARRAADDETIAEAEEALRDTRTALDAALAADRPLWPDEGDVPLLLLPLRIEAVYSSVAGSAELLIRVFPDDVHVDAHERGLTKEEREAGERYWRETAERGAAEAWSLLLARLGPARAAWTREATDPGGPEPAEADGTWTHAAHTRLLPDRFLFSAYEIRTHGELHCAWRREGREIADDLKVGFRPPSREEEPTENRSGRAGLERLPWDEESAWLVDFDVAEEQGMALRYPLEYPELRYELLTVVGVDIRSTAAESAARWQDTLLSHQYGGGLAFLPTRTPTNNTPATRSGWVSRPEPRPPEKVDELRAAYDPRSAQAAARAAAALGIDGLPVLAAAPHADADDADADLALLHRAFGLLYSRSPVLLPWAEPTAAGTAAVKVPDLSWLVEHFTRHVRSRGTLPTVRIGRQPYGLLPVSALDLWRDAETDPRLSEHLSSLRSSLEDHGTGHRLDVREGGADREDEIIDLLRRTPSSEEISGWPATWLVEDTRPDVAADRVLVGSIPRDSRAAFGYPTRHHKWYASRPVVPAPSAELKKKLAELPLTKLLALSHELPNDAWRADPDGFGAEHERALEPVMAENGPWDFYDFALQAIKAYQEARVAAEPAALAGLDPETAAYVAGRLAWARATAEAFVALERSAAEDLPSLDRLMFEALDTLSYRADAWITSLADARLRGLRATRPQGLHVGAYGWLTEVAPGELGEDGTPVSKDEGFIVTPSLHHAATAAVLRAGMRSHAEPQALAVDLQSWRARAALEVVDGVREGRPLPALLGYRFERGLHENGLDRLIEGFRARYPLELAVDPTAPVPEGATSSAARNVVDGERLRAVPPGDGDPLAGADDGEHKIISGLVADLTETVDAVADLLLAESVHHLVGGDPLRAGLSADAIGRGDGLPQEFDVLRTPRSATAIGHHLGFLCPAGAVADGWNGARALARLEPSLEAWCRGRLGAAGAWRFTRKDGSAVGLDALGWCALEVVSASRGGQGGSPLLVALGKAAGGALGAAGEARAAELALVCERLRAVVAAGAPLLPGHLNAADPQAPITLDLAELAERTVPWVNEVVAARDALEAALGSGAPGPVLERLGLLGLFFAPPPPDADPVRYGTRVLDLLKDLKPLPDVPAGGSEDEAVAFFAAAEGAVKDVLGDAVQLLPLLKGAALPDQNPPGAEPDEVADWLREIAAVRPPAAAFDEALVLADLVAGSGTGAYLVVQGPDRPGARWIATSSPVQGDTDSPIRFTTVLHADRPAGPGAVAGLIADSWSEAVPRPNGEHGPEEIAGVAFHHDGPGAMAPQALLLAVPPDPARGWRMEDVHGAVEDTLALARIRTVDLEDLGEMASLLPIPEGK